MNTFTVGSCVRFGWETFKKRPWFFVAFTIVYIVVSWAISFVVGLIAGQGHALTSLISLPFNALLTMGLIASILKAHDNVEAVRIADLWHPQHYWNYLIAYIVIVFSVLIGLVLLIVPGIIIGIMFGFAPYLVIERSLGPIEAIKESMRITKGHRWDLFVLALANIGIAIVGFICLFVGMFVAIPIILLASVHAYRTLSKITEAVPTPAV